MGYTKGQVSVKLQSNKPQNQNLEVTPPNIESDSSHTNSVEIGVQKNKQSSKTKEQTGADRDAFLEDLRNFMIRW